jgi:hypothetical protein
MTFEDYVRLLQQNFKAAKANDIEIGILAYEQELQK